MAGIGPGVVFLILLLLVCILLVFGYVTQGKKVTPVAASQSVNVKKSVPKASAADEAAVAMAVYLYMNGRHDEESGVLTIHVNEHSLWHEELNERL